MDLSWGHDYIRNSKDYRWDSISNLEEWFIYCRTNRFVAQKPEFSYPLLREWKKKSINWATKQELLTSMKTRYAIGILTEGWANTHSLTQTRSNKQKERIKEITIHLYNPSHLTSAKSEMYKLILAYRRNLIYFNFLFSFISVDA